MARAKYDSISEATMATENALAMVTVTAAALSHRDSAAVLGNDDLARVMWVLNDKLTGIVEFLQSRKVKALEAAHG